MASNKQADNDQISLKEWWNYQHDICDGFYLTGSKGPEVWSYLNISDKIFEGQTVLNIGVGLGHCTQELAKRGCLVHAFDISEIALKRVQDVAAGTWKPGEFSLENTFDLAISNLVTQHMSNEDLIWQLQDVISSLKPEGIFAMQFAYRLDENISQSNESLRNMKVGGVCRSLSEMNEFVKATGGSIIWSEKIGTFPEHNSGWYGIHIAKSGKAEF